MIQTPPPRIARAFERAARLRATGMGYPEIARQLNQNVSTVTNWAYRYRAYWNQLIAANQQTVASDARSEATAALRVMLRSDDERIRRDAAKVILDACGPIAPTPDSPPISDLEHFADYLEGLNDDDLLAILGAKVPRDVAGPEGGAGGVSTPTSAG